MTRIALIDHGAGNLVSAARGLERSGATVAVVSAASDLAGADGVVLPGVGTTGAAMTRLEQLDLVEALESWTRPLLGICVGLQLFFETSEEDNTECLGFMSGRVAKLPAAPLLPHIGWNDVALGSDPIFAGLRDNELFYFVHSFAPVPSDEGDVIGWAEYGSRFAAAARRDNRVGVQFHPERSGPAGLAVLSNFVASCEEARRAA
ncbi:MAG: imidazole glycerol phosphate synthase subunit HisH [Acidimicrobiia bacterium]|nr:imidazole glycerol phosphate synthase subunit HisH [Acidimicrobiia bacterium]